MAPGNRIRSSKIVAVLRLGALAIALALGCSYGIAFGGPFGWLLSAALVGLLAAATTRGPLTASGVAVVAGFSGGLYAFRRFAVPGVLKALARWHNDYPIGLVHDRFLGPLLKSGAVNATWTQGGRLLPFAMAGVSVAVAFAAAALVNTVREADRNKVRLTLSIAAVGLVGAILVLGSWSSPFREDSTRRLPNGSYHHDSGIYMNVYFNVLAGKPYYEGFVDAAAGDSRLIALKAVRDGKLHAWAYSPAFIRMPWTFYIWRALAPTGGLYYVSLLACVLALFGVFWALYPVLTYRAALVPPLLFPLFLTHASWTNIYLPDWWAGLAILFSVLFQVRRRYALAGVFAFLAAIFRDFALIWLVLLLANALWLYFRGRKSQWKRRAVAYALMIAAFFTLYFIHLRAGIPYVAEQPGAPGIAGRLRDSAVLGFDQRFLAPASYLMFPYGESVVRRALLVFAQVPGWWLVLRRDPPALVPVLALVLFWIAFTLTIGAPSSYWGQMYMPLAVVGSASLLAFAAPDTRKAV